MKLTWKPVSILGTVLLCCPLFAHIQWKRVLEQPPKKVYAVHDMAPQKIVKKNRKLYAHLIPNPVDPQKQFFQTILENNLFAPLGWKPTAAVPTYRLIGTHVPTDRKMDATAILHDTAKKGNVRVVSIGTKLGGDTVVFDIQPKQVILKKGKQRITLSLSKFQFLK